jgi:UDP-2-acetamido-3-amino-2,3-dideoxy-glucuronate N-acetyltransferase
LKKVNVVIVGAGDWGKNLIKNFNKTANIIGVCDKNDLAIKQVYEQYKIGSILWEQILAQKEIDAVVIATNKSHYELARQALLANKHVFIEKPLAPNVTQAKDLYNIALNLNKKLMVGHLLQYNPAFIELKKICNNGCLGEVLYAYSNRLSFGKFMPEEDVLLSLASHDFSMMLSLMGKPKSVDAFANCFLVDQIADHAMIRLQFNEKKFGHIFVSWMHPYKERKLVVIGSKAMAVFDDLEIHGNKLKVYYHDLNIGTNNDFNNNKEQSINLSLENLKSEVIDIKDQQEPLFKEVEHFIKCIQHDLIPNTDGNEAIEVLQVIEKIYHKLDYLSGKKIKNQLL